MTNNQYETLCISNALLGPAKLAAVDAKITETEQALVFLLHARREIVNQYDLNKCRHDFESVSIAGLGCVDSVCRKCGVAK